MQGWTQRIGNDSFVAQSFIEGLIKQEAERYQPPAMNWSQKWSDSKEILSAGIGKDQLITAPLSLLHECGEVYVLFKSSEAVSA